MSNSELSSQNNVRSKNLMFISITIFFLSASLLIGSVSYLIATNPDINIALKDRAQSDKELSYDKHREWQYDVWSDVSENSDQYPIVVLRSGFKLLKINSGNALIGWMYEIVNTSKSTIYTTSVSFELEDKDSFLLNQGEGSVKVKPDSFEIVRGTIEIPLSDLERLSGSSWRIGLSPNWVITEANTEGKRYDRLKAILSQDKPYWITQYLESDKKGFLDKYSNLSDKWKAIEELVEPADAESSVKSAEAESSVKTQVD